MIPIEPTAPVAIIKHAVMKEIDQFFSKLDPDKRLEKAWNGPEGWQEWLVNLRANFWQAFSYLNARIDNFEAHLQPVLEDHQFFRIFKNFTFEAAREAIDERCLMLKHAAVGVGMLDPDISIVRKARVERTLRTLDPDDVLYLYGASRIPFSHANSGAVMANFLNETSSGDILASSGCVRMKTSGGGFGVGIWTDARITQLGLDVLETLYTYTAVRTLKFVVPGREIGPQDRSEQEARQVLNRITGLDYLANRSMRRKSEITLSYYRNGNSACRTLAFSMLNWAEWRTRLEEIAAESTSTELTIKLVEPTDEDPKLGPIQALRVEITGPHDLLRYVADDCEATWHV